MQIHLFVKSKADSNGKIDYLKENLEVPVCVHTNEYKVNENVYLLYLPALVLIDENHDKNKEQVWISNVREIWSGKQLENKEWKDIVIDVENKIKELEHG